MAVSLKPAHLKRYKDLAVLFVKYGRSDVVRAAGLEAELEAADRAARAAARGGESPPEPEAEELAADLERMGPTYIKLGQLLSTRADFLPPPYLEALSRLQDNVAPFPYAEVERIITEELGVRISKAFSWFDTEPLAAASLAQVHRAALRDGREVVVKVQRPEIRQQVIDDLEAFEHIAAVLQKTKWGERYDFGALLNEFRRTLLSELNYLEEAANLTTLAENLASFERIVVPRPVADYCTARVLTMDYVPGKKITALSPLARIEMDGTVLAEQLFRAYLKQIFVDGFFHADPHPGNVFLTDQGRIALLDLGMVARLASRMQEQLLQIVLAISEGRGEDTTDYLLRIAEPREEFDERELRRRVADLVARHQDATLGRMQVGRAFVEMARASGETGLRLPPELTMLGKALLNLDAIGRLLAPDFDPNASVQRNAARILNQRMLKSLSPGNLFSGVLEAKDLVTRLPGRVNKILDAAAANELGLKVDTGIDAAQLMAGMQKVANRIAMGTVLAALIIGAALLMRIPTAFTLFGYPGFAMLFFLAGALGGSALLLHTLFTDVHSRRAARAERRTNSKRAAGKS